jgi:hypothetical protein
MRLLFIILTLTLTITSQAQKVSDLDKYSIDTVRLTNFNAKKVIVFKHNDATFYLDFAEYKIAVADFKKMYLKGYKRRLDEVNSALKNAKRQFKKTDTAYMTQQDFNNFGVQPMEKFIATQIDKGNCLVHDINNSPLTQIIRVTGSFIRGPLNAWAGRRYYLPGQDKYILLVTTSIS